MIIGSSRSVNTFRHLYMPLRIRCLGDMEVTEEMKQAIIKTVDYTLKNPWTVPTE